MELLTFLCLQEREVILWAIASICNSPFQLFHTILTSVDQNSLVQFHTHALIGAVSSLRVSNIGMPRVIGCLIVEQGVHALGLASHKWLDSCTSDIINNYL